jgi:hypothetical protein
MEEERDHLGVGVGGNGVLDEVEHDVVRNESALGHDLLDALAQRALLVPFRAQQLAGRDLRQAVVALDPLALRALACIFLFIFGFCFVLLIKSFQNNKNQLGLSRGVRTTALWVAQSHTDRASGQNVIIFY